MPFISSPVSYPPTSSPHDQNPSRKRRRVETRDERDRQPLQKISDNLGDTRAFQTIAGFVVDDESDDDREPAKSSVVRRNTELAGLDAVQDDVEVRGTGAEASANLLPAGQGENGSLGQDLPKDDASRHSHAQSGLQPRALSAVTCSGRSLKIYQRRTLAVTPYSELVAARSDTPSNRAKKEYYGINVHALIEANNAASECAAAKKDIETCHPSIESSQQIPGRKQPKSLLWTEKYRARKFTDLVGDERTHRAVLRWLKAWDSIVFPHQARPKAKASLGHDASGGDSDRPHRKILLLTGPPGLGKTTLAHVCARQAGYETQEINASDERSRDVVKGRIRDMVGTENVRAATNGKSQKAAKPVCIVVDEVDGVVSGNSSTGGGEGGFIKALVDLLALDARNSKNVQASSATTTTRKKKGDSFRLLRPLILICNDVYHPALRLLRQGMTAEIIHVRKPALSMIIPRMSAIFEREGLPCDSDGVRTLCEATWGVSSRNQGSGLGGGNAEGDIRGILVVAQWVAAKLRADTVDNTLASARLTKKWLQQEILGELAHGGGAARSLGRGGSREVTERVFLHNGGFPAASSASTGKRKNPDVPVTEQSGGLVEASKKYGMDRLREMIECSGEEERIMTDCFANYPLRQYQDDTTFTKPSVAHDWLYFHSALSHRVHTAQEWDLAPYLSYPILAFHTLFSSSSSQASRAQHATNEADTSETQAPVHPLMTPRADFAASELTRANSATLTHLHTTLSLPLQRSFRSSAALATELVPYTLRMLNPDVKPVLVSGAVSVRRGPERERVDRATQALLATGVKLEKSRIEAASGRPEGDAAEGFAATRPSAAAAWVYRMEPPLDELGAFATMSKDGTSTGGDAGKARYALRQVLEQTHRRELAKREAEARLRRATTGIEELRGVTDAEMMTQDEQKAGSKTTNAADEHKAAKKAAAVKRDFFGRPIVSTTAAGDAIANTGSRDERVRQSGAEKRRARVWVSYNEGYSNAVRKPITLKGLLEGL